MKMRTVEIGNYCSDCYPFIEGAVFKEVVILTLPWAYCLTN
jgi:hypothetical protein